MKTSLKVHTRKNTYIKKLENPLSTKIKNSKKIWHTVLLEWNVWRRGAVLCALSDLLHDYFRDEHVNQVGNFCDHRRIYSAESKCSGNFWILIKIAKFMEISDDVTRLLEF